MGRYYNGDIEGKFMFAVQSSTAADRFGSEGYSNYLEYYFSEDHIPTIEEQLKILKPSFKKVSKFFEELEKKGKNGYSTKDTEEANIKEQELSDFSDYRLGKQIYDCIKEQGECRFDAEL